ncbi:alpha/beta fold hydrolase [Actinoplanes sp. NPDC051859]|uniref:alpha/beta fold hydrolase n=1 Tax=Actinoplanes sp. NPDC051859 TaxID=3363909 RepID=UPI00379D1290
MPYTQLGAVNTWWDEHGAGDPVVLLHPGGADSRAFDVTLALADALHVYRFDRRGHGRTADVDGPIGYAQMADDTAAFLTEVVGGPAHLVGHSDGAPVALLTALRHPGLVRRLVFASGVFHHEGWRPGVLDLDDEATEFLSSWYGEVSPDGPAHWPVVAAKLDRMHRTEPVLTTADLAGIETPTLLMFGDDDEVEPPHLHALHRGLSNVQLAIVPGAGHGVLLDRPELCHLMIRDFLSSTEM